MPTGKGTATTVGRRGLMDDQTIVVLVLAEGNIRIDPVRCPEPHCLPARPSAAAACLRLVGSGSAVRSCH